VEELPPINASELRANKIAKEHFVNDQVSSLIVEMQHFNKCYQESLQIKSIKSLA
jgi:hypothetical protein